MFGIQVYTFALLHDKAEIMASAMCLLAIVTYIIWLMEMKSPSK